MKRNTITFFFCFVMTILSAGCHRSNWRLEEKSGSPPAAWTTAMQVLEGDQLRMYFELYRGPGYEDRGLVNGDLNSEATKTLAALMHAHLRDAVKAHAWGDLDESFGCGGPWGVLNAVSSNGESRFGIYQPHFSPLPTADSNIGGDVVDFEDIPDYLIDPALLRRWGITIGKTKNSPKDLDLSYPQNIALVCDDESILFARSNALLVLNAESLRVIREIEPPNEYWDIDELEKGMVTSDGYHFVEQGDILDIRSGKPVLDFYAEEDEPGEHASSKTSTGLTKPVVYADGIDIFLYDPQVGKATTIWHREEGDAWECTYVRMLSDEKVLAVFEAMKEDSGKVMLYDLKSGAWKTVASDVSMSSDWRLRALRAAQADPFLVVSNNKTVVLDLRTGERVFEEAHSAVSICVLPSQNAFLSARDVGSSQTLLQVRAIPSGELIGQAVIPGLYEAFLLSSDGKRLYGVDRINDRIKRMAVEF